MNSGKPAIVIGRQLFVDLWSIYGFTPVVCESPRELPQIMQSITDIDAVIVIVEKDWFQEVPKSMLSKLKLSKRPVWVPFPGIEPVNFVDER